MSLPTSIQIESYVVAMGRTTVEQVRRRFRLSDQDWQRECERLSAYGVEIDAGGRIRVPEEARAA
jgi:hypothetical protein